MHGHLTYTFDPCPEGTRFRQQETLIAEGPLRPFSGIIGRSLARHLAARMDDIRILAESGSVDPGTPTEPHGREVEIVAPVA